MPNGTIADYYAKKREEAIKAAYTPPTPTRDLFAEREKTTYRAPSLPAPPPSLSADVEDLPGTWNLMNQITALQGPEAYPGLANFAETVGFTEAEVEGYFDAIDTYYANQPAAAAPALPPALPPPTAPDEGYKMFKWSEGGYEAAGGAAPDWWEAFIPEEVTPETAYGAMLNAMIPFISPEDQVRVAHSLYTMFDTEMSHYKPGNIPEVSTVSEDQARYLMAQGRPVSGVWGKRGEKELEPLSDPMRRYFMSSKRATDAIDTLSNMREAMVQGNRWKLGPGYKWLQNIMGSVAGRGASGETAQTREQYLSMLSSVDPFLSQAGGGELQAFGPLGQMLTKPYFTAGQVQPQQAGRFGAPNRRFF